LCVPLVHQNNLTGLLCLENGIVRDAFTQERIELLQLLCAQVAIALENARLYERARHASDALHEVNTRLEAEVVARTNDLHEANGRLLKRGDELDTINQRLQQELEERHRSDRERADLQDTIIRNQRTRLAEMGTPLIPISAEVVAMPLIGTVDRERADQILETALRGAQHARAQFIILDITGIHVVDNGVAETLVRTARALQLLGTSAIITGVRADVAQTLVGLDVDMSNIVCLGRLQDGINWAQKRLRRSSMR
jgi:anti-anti-sigma regulatory factor